MLKYCASVMDPKDLKSMISKHQNHILGSLGFQIHSNTQNKKTENQKKERRQRSLKFQTKNKLEFTPCQS